MLEYWVENFDKFLSEKDINESILIQDPVPT